MTTALGETSCHNPGAGLVGSLSCFCLLHRRQGEKRADIQLNSFGFYTNGSLEVDLSLLRLGLQETEEKAPLVRGFEECATGGGRGAEVSGLLPHNPPPPQLWIPILAMPLTRVILGKSLGLSFLIYNMGIIIFPAICARH